MPLMLATFAATKPGVEIPIRLSASARYDIIVTARRENELNALGYQLFNRKKVEP